MPDFENNPLEQLALTPQDAERTIDLGDMATEQALARVELALQQATPEQTLCFTFTGAQGDGRETLFLPLGRLLLQARREGRLQHCLPITQGNGFVVTLAAPPE